MSMNKNHPKKGSRITVDPIRNIKDIKKVKRKLRSNPRDLLLFTLGVNIGIWVSSRIWECLEVSPDISKRDLLVSDE